MARPSTGQVVNMERGFTGLLVTCNQLHERKAVREIYDTVSSLVDTLQPKESPADNIDEELEALQDGKQPQSAIQQIRTRVKGCLLFQWKHASLTMQEVFPKIYQLAKEDDSFSLGHIAQCKLIEYSFYPTEDLIQEHALKCLSDHVDLAAAKAKGHTYCVVAKVRHHKHFGTTLIKEIVGKVIPLPIHYKDPDYILLIDIVQLVVTISFTTRQEYHQYQQYNMSKYIEGPQKRSIEQVDDTPTPNAKKVKTCIEEPTPP